MFLSLYKDQGGEILSLETGLVRCSLCSFVFKHISWFLICSSKYSPNITVKSYMNLKNVSKCKPLRLYPPFLKEICDYYDCLSWNCRTKVCSQPLTGRLIRIFSLKKSCFIVHMMFLQYVWDRMLGGFKHKNNRTREGVCLCLIATLNTWVSLLRSFCSRRPIGPSRDLIFKNLCPPVSSFLSCCSLLWSVCLTDMEPKAWLSIKLFLIYVTSWGTPLVR